MDMSSWTGNHLPRNIEKDGHECYSVPNGNSLVFQNLSILYQLDGTFQNSFESHLVTCHKIKKKYKVIKLAIFRTVKPFSSVHNNSGLQ